MFTVRMAPYDEALMGYAHIGIIVIELGCFCFVKFTGMFHVHLLLVELVLIRGAVESLLSTNFDVIGSVGGFGSFDLSHDYYASRWCGPWRIRGERAQEGGLW